MTNLFGEVIVDPEPIATGGRFLAVEAKMPGKEPTPRQETFLASVNAMGGLGLCVHSVDELVECFQGAEHGTV